VQGKIERGGTRRALKHCLHKGRHGARGNRARAVADRKSRKTLTFWRAAYADLRWALDRLLQVPVHYRKGFGHDAHSQRSSGKWLDHRVDMKQHWKVSFSVREEVAASLATVADRHKRPVATPYPTR
jgi:hypothetical protein